MLTNQSNQRSKPLVIAHRGASAEAPENTLAAFRLALEQGCDAIELDVHLSKDGRLIVCHDATIDKTTNGTGSIVDMTAEELQQYDAGSWFHARYAGERLPLLDEVLDLVPASIDINIEIKSTDHPRIIESLVELLQQRGRMDSVFVSCFDHPLLVRLKQAAPAVRIGLLYDDAANEALSLFERERIEVFSLHPYDKLAGDTHIQMATAQGMQMYPWTVNDSVRMKQLIAAGISGIITDYPGRMRQLIG